MDESQQNEQQRAISPEDLVSLYTYVITPDMKELTVNKDVGLSNLNEREIWLLREILTHKMDLKLTKPIGLGVVKKDGSEIYDVNVSAIIHTARARDGFQQKIFGTSVQKWIKQEENKKLPEFWRKK